jgi:catechol 2,3-dioxygenase-like lactoylglutathione lyase family enzyme
MGFVIDHLDHLVLTVDSIDATVAFYTSALGMELVTFGNRKALRFGEQKINLHQVGREFEPKAVRPTAGSGDLCFITKAPIEKVIAHLNANDCAIELARISHHHWFRDTIESAESLLLCFCVMGLTGRGNFCGARPCMRISRVVFCKAPPGRCPEPRWKCSWPRAAGFNSAGRGRLVRRGFSRDRPS